MKFRVIGHCRKGWVLERAMRLCLKHFHLHLSLLGPLLSAALGLQPKPCGGLYFVKVVPVEVLVKKTQQAKGCVARIPKSIRSGHCAPAPMYSCYTRDRL